LTAAYDQRSSGFKPPLVYQPESTGDMGLGHGLHEAGKAGFQAFIQLLGFGDGVGPLLVRRVHPVVQVVPPSPARRPAQKERDGHQLPLAWCASSSSRIIM
jgi:hypothetical protein